MICSNVRWVLGLKYVAWIQKITKNIGFEVLRAVIMNTSIFWDITPCSPLKVNRRFGGRQRRNVPSKRRFTFNGIHGVISKKIGLCKLNLYLHDCFYVWSYYLSSAVRYVEQYVLFFKHSSMALQLFVGPWPLFQFRNPIYSRYHSLDRGPDRHRTTQTQINAHRHPCL
jgi:hypothetical protein